MFVLAFSPCIGCIALSTESYKTIFKTPPTGSVRYWRALFLQQPQSWWTVTCFNDVTHCRIIHCRLRRASQQLHWCFADVGTDSEGVESSKIGLLWNQCEHHGVQSMADKTRCVCTLMAFQQWWVSRCLRRLANPKLLALSNRPPSRGLWPYGLGSQEYPAFSSARLLHFQTSVFRKVK